MYRVLFLFFISSLQAVSLCPGAPCHQNACDGWRSLQQLRSLIPERIWEQDFSVIMSRDAFRKAIRDWSRQKGKEWDPSATRIAGTQCYFLRSTLSGEEVRILDRYQEVAGSPFWNTPPMMIELRKREIQILEGCR